MNTLVTRRILGFCPSLPYSVELALQRDPWRAVSGGRRSSYPWWWCPSRTPPREQCRRIFKQTVFVFLMTIILSQIEKKTWSKLETGIEKTIHRDNLKSRYFRWHAFLICLAWTLKISSTPKKLCNLTFIKFIFSKFRLVTYLSSLAASISAITDV